MNSVLLILVSGLLGVAGQILMKQGTSALASAMLGPDSLLGVVATLVVNPLVLGGLAIYACGTFFWLVALSRLDLSYAYPFASVNYIFILVASWWILGEQPSAMRIVGVVAICLGVWAISRTPGKTTPGRKQVSGSQAPAPVDAKP